MQGSTAVSTQIKPRSTGCSATDARSLAVLLGEL
jgi:hypothetical protein